jgi:hypothetical protein
VSFIECFFVGLVCRVFYFFEALANFLKQFFFCVGFASSIKNFGFSVGLCGF